MKITDTLENLDSLENLWKSVASVGNSRVIDNQRYQGDYPLSIRNRQHFDY